MLLDASLNNHYFNFQLQHRKIILLFSVLCLFSSYHTEDTPKRTILLCPYGLVAGVPEAHKDKGAVFSFGGPRHALLMTMPFIDHNQ